MSVLIHVADWRAATEWYARAFANAIRIYPETDDYGHLDAGGVALEIEGGDRICQVRDPWGNCIGLRQMRDQSYNN
ncbi:VOC family protein [Pseudomonas fluorescens]|uniref:VOC family protein n=1 Tax=Pseudomonas fluorescens TaxID=294 RepID=UPI001E3296B9|nr:hypothetical protein [Pseudomonas fluorescens]